MTSGAEETIVGSGDESSGCEGGDVREIPVVGASWKSEKTWQENWNFSRSLRRGLKASMGILTYS